MKTIVFVTCLSLVLLAATACAPAPQTATATPRPTTPARPTPTPTSAPPTITPIPIKPTPAEPTPRVPREARSKGMYGGFVSKSLEGNLLGTAATRLFYVYLPPGYDESAERYPVIYALPLWSTGNATDFGIPDAIDRWVLAGMMPEVILVEVDMHSTHYVGDFYQSNPVVGDWPGYVANDLVGYIDGKYRTLPDPASRAILGLEDAGGGGAIHMGLKRPDVFGIVATMAPGLGSEHFLRDCAIKVYFTGSGHMWAPPWACEELAVALSLSFAVNSDKEPFAPPPAVEVDGRWQLVPEVWEKGKEVHPAYDLDGYTQQKAGLKAMLLVQGATDQATNVNEVRAFVQRMIAAGIPVDYREVITPDEWGHHFWDNDMLLDFLSKQLAFE